VLYSILDSQHDLDRLQPTWEGLLAQSASSSVFLTWDWANAWWRHYGNGRKLCILSVQDAGRVAGLVPLFRGTSRRIGLSYRTLHFVGDGSWDSDYLDVVSREEDRETVVDAFARFLHDSRQSCDVLFLSEVPEDSASVPLLRRFAERQGWHWEETRVPCAYVDLPADWEAFLRRLAPRMRTKIRSLVRSLEQTFDVRYERCDREDELPPRLQDLFRLHELRWTGKNGSGVFQSREKREFYADMARAFLCRGALRLHSLRVDGRHVAHQFCLEHANRMFLLQEGFDPSWDRHGVGNVLRAHVFRDCIERGIRTYDFLAGVTPHKKSWGAEVKYTLRAQAGRPSAKNALYFAVPRCEERLKGAAKRVLPQRVLAWARSVAS
jgi:CelD/BcsL family acetyltransferase involved in cellulose biosynthesis